MYGKTSPFIRHDETEEDMIKYNVPVPDSGKVVKVKLGNDLINRLACGYFDYAVGRATYIVGTCVRFLSDNAKALTKETRDYIAGEILKRCADKPDERQGVFGLGMSCDRDQWIRLAYSFGGELPEWYKKELLGRLADESYRQLVCDALDHKVHDPRVLPFAEEPSAKVTVARFDGGEGLGLAIGSVLRLDASACDTDSVYMSGKEYMRIIRDNPVLRSPKWLGNLINDLDDPMYRFVSDGDDPMPDDFKLLLAWLRTLEPTEFVPNGRTDDCGDVIFRHGTYVEA